MNKKGIWGWEEISKLLIVIIIIVIIITIIFFLKDRGISLVEGIRNMFRFG